MMKIRCVRQTAWWISDREPANMVENSDFLQNLSADKLLLLGELHIRQKGFQLLYGKIGDLINILIRHSHSQ